MARRVKTTTVKEELPDKGIVDSDGEETPVVVSENFEELEGFLQQFEPSSVRTEVYKEGPSAKMEYCYTIGGTDVDKDSIRDGYGGGKYELRVFAGNVHLRSVVFRIANKPVAAIVNNGGNIEANILREQNNFFQRMILTLMANKNDGGLGLRDVVELVTRNQHSPDALLNVFTKGMEIANKSAGDGATDWKMALVGALKDALPVVGQVIAERQAVTVANGNGQHQVTQSPDAMLKGIFAEMKKQVLGGLPVGLALDWVLANAQQPKYQPIIHAALKAEYQEFVAIDPELANEPFKSWFTTLQEGVRKAYAAANQNDDDSAGSGGD